VFAYRELTQFVRADERGVGSSKDERHRAVRHGVRDHLQTGHLPGLRFMAGERDQTWQRGETPRDEGLSLDAQHGPQLTPHTLAARRT